VGRGVVEECDMPSNPGTHYPATCVKGRFVLMLAFPHTTPAGEDKPHPYGQANLSPFPQVFVRTEGQAPGTVPTATSHLCVVCRL